jgi:hypothetical protein
MPTSHKRAERRGKEKKICAQECSDKHSPHYIKEKEPLCVQNSSTKNNKEINGDLDEVAGLT